MILAYPIKDKRRQGLLQKLHGKDWFFGCEKKREGGMMALMKRVGLVFLALLLASCGREKGEFNVAKRIQPGEKKHFVVLTMSYNNEEFVERNARSVLDQDYPNFEWIYIDDCSRDRTYEKVCALAEGKTHVTLIRNEENHGAMRNMYETIHRLKNDDIVVILDGDDWFAHNQVLSHLNEYYADERVWLTYGQHIEYPSFTVGMCQPLKKRFLKPGGFRKAKFLFSHLRTFYAGLFQRVDARDFQKDGTFLKMGCDVASMLPMLEMAGEHAFFIRELLVVYNMGNPINDAKKNLALQQKIDQYIRSLPTYSALEGVRLDKREIR